jgi:UDP-glucose 4-epimerase
MKILVTGASGSLMRAVIPRLLENGHEVRGVDNYGRYGREAPPVGIEFIEGDLTERDLVRRVLHGVDGVVQAAAQIYGVAGFHQFPADILHRDTLLHGLILDEAARADVQRVVYISSSMVYERQPNVARESDVPDMVVPHTEYGMSKLTGERLSMAFSKQYELAYTIWRPFNIISLHETAEGREPGISHVFADFTQRIIRDHQNPMLILGSGEQIRCFTWIGDVADGIANWSFSTETRNDDFNLGNAEPVSMLDLARRMYAIYHELLGVAPERPLSFRHGPTFSDDVLVRIPDASKAAARLGWRPTIKLDEMLRRTLVNELERSRNVLW